jgi:hypothetical protein
MKKLFTLLAIVTTVTIFAQAPQGFNYQAIVRNSSGQLLLNQDVRVKFNILQNSSTGDIVYSETQTANTDDLGQINLVVGLGTAPTGTFSTINWGNGSYYLGIELNSGSGYVEMGTTQLLSVPYALYANSAGNETSIGSISSASNPNGAKITSGVMSLTPADSTNGGIITNNTQTIAGEKIFNSDMKINGITVGRGLGQLSSNTILGRSSLIANTTGDSNTVTGAYSLSSNTTGNSNIAIGNTALGNNITGNNNIAIGNATLRSNYNGNNNTAIGSSAGVTVDNLTNATAIGYSAVVANSNAIQLGNSAVTSINTSGNYKGNGFVKNGGTSSQYLMADGTVATLNKKYRLEYISGDGQIYSGGGMHLPMVFRIFNITDNKYVTSISQEGLSLNSKANIGYEDANFNNLNNYCGSGENLCFGGYYYIPSTGLPAKPFNLIVNVTMKYSNTGEVIDRYIINQYIQ